MIIPCYNNPNSVYKYLQIQWLIVTIIRAIHTVSLPQLIHPHRRHLDRPAIPCQFSLPKGASWSVHLELKTLCQRVGLVFRTQEVLVIGGVQPRYTGPDLSHHSVKLPG